MAERFVGLMTRQGHHPNVALSQAADEIIAQTCLRVMIPKRFSMPMHEIWELQPRFEQRTPAKAKRLLTHPRFRAAYDFLLLRAATGDANPELAAWWTAAQGAGADLHQTGAAQAEGDEDDGGDESPNSEAGSGAEGAVAAKKRRRRGGRGRSARS